MRTHSIQRLAAVESNLSPKAIVLAWMAEAQQYDDMGAYVQALVAGPTIQMPLDILIKAAIDNASVRTRGQSAQVAADARTRDVRAVVYRFFLVHQSCVLTEAAIDRAGLIYCSLVATVGGYFLGTKSDRPPLERLERLREMAIRQVTSLLALQAARERISSQHFDGRSLLFPGMEREWSSHVSDAQMLCVMILRLAELDAGIPIDVAETEPSEAQIGRQVVAHVDAARVKTYDLLDDGPRLREALRAWLLPEPVASLGRTP